MNVNENLPAEGKDWVAKKKTRKRGERRKEIGEEEGMERIGWCEEKHEESRGGRRVA